MRHEPLIEVRNLRTWFTVKAGLMGASGRQTVKAVDGVTLSIRNGEVLGLVGESGSGKTTLGRSILRLVEPTTGTVTFKGRPVTGMKTSAMRALRREMQIIFQDPGGSLDPRMSVGEIIAEGLQIHGIGTRKEQQQRVADLLRLVDLEPEYAARYPHEFSGGQRQRIGVARALALQPELIICDEPISALDVSVQAQVVNLLEDLQKEMNLTYLFIAHDLSMVRHISDRVAVMYLGVMAELADREELYSNPLHPYTIALLSAVPIPSPVIEAKRKRIILKGDVPSPVNPPSGCRFHTRCPLAEAICSEKRPEWREVRPDHFVACHLVQAEGMGKTKASVVTSG